jgi:hypothetical protein
MPNGILTYFQPLLFVLLLLLLLARRFLARPSIRISPMAAFAFYSFLVLFGAFSMLLFRLRLSRGLIFFFNILLIKPNVLARNKLSLWLLGHIGDSWNCRLEDDIWDGMIAGMKSAEEQYPDELGPWTDFEWGMLSGKLSAIRWVLGDEWDMLDT